MSFIKELKDSGLNLSGTGIMLYEVNPIDCESIK